MKRIALLVALVGLLAACNQKDETKNKASENQEIEINEVPQLALASFEDEAKTHVDKEVSVEGIVDHVCKHGGKKLLLVVDGASVHVVATEKRFDDALVGQQVSLTGIVREERIDESTCLQMEEDAIKNHSEGEANDEVLERKKKQIQFYRDSMATAGIDHLSYYSLDFIAFNNL